MTDTTDFTKQAQDMMATDQKMAQPEQAQEMIKDGIEKTKEAYDKAAEAMGSASKEYENVLSSAQSGTRELSEKAVENFKANSTAVFEFASALASCSSPAEAVEVQSAFVQKQFDQFNKQTKDFFELSNKVTADVVQSAAAAAKKSSIG